MFEHREWSINNEPIIDIMDVAIAEDLNIDTYFDFIIIGLLVIL